MTKNVIIYENSIQFTLKANYFFYFCTEKLKIQIYYGKSI